jgi:hypothetical protein
MEATGLAVILEKIQGKKSIKNEVYTTSKSIQHIAKNLTVFIDTTNSKH